MFGNVRNRETLKKNTRISIDLRTWISIDFLVPRSTMAVRSTIDGSLLEPEPVFITISYYILLHKPRAARKFFVVH